MNCPKCKEELDHVNAYSECFQRVTIDEDGHTSDWSSPEVLETTLFECPVCQEDVSSLITD
jgi:transcription initiation factor IIE alpha subunit